MYEMKSFVKDLIIMKIDGDITEAAIDNAIDDCDSTHDIFEESAEITDIDFENLQIQEQGKRKMYYGKATVVARVPYGYIDLEDAREQAYSNETVDYGVGSETFEFWIGIDGEGEVWCTDFEAIED